MQQVSRLPDGFSDHLLATAVESTGDCLALVDRNGLVLRINAAGATALGFGSPDAALGRNWIEAWCPADRDALRDGVTAALAGTRATARTALNAAAGVFTWWDTTIVAVPPPLGGAEHLLTISRDVTERVEAGSALERSTRLQQALIEATSEIVWHLDATTGVTLRRGYSAFTGKEDDPTDMDGWLAAVHPDDIGPAKRAADAAEASRGLLIIEYRLRHRTGEWRWVEDRAVPLIGEDGVATDWVGIISDVHERKSAEHALQKSAEHLRLALEATGLCTWEINLRTGKQDWSPEMHDLLGLPRSTHPDRHLLTSRVHPDDRARVDAQLNGSDADAGDKRVTLFRLVRPTGEPRWIEINARTILDPAGNPIRRVGTMQDVTDRKQAEHEIWLAAHTDALTGIANRALFQTRLDQCIAEAGERGASMGLFLIDLDRFKEVNDALGHDAGDTLLRTVADRLNRHVAADATVARLGGDEFGVIVPSAAGSADFDALASRLLAALKEPLDYADREIDCSSSIGWSAYPDHDRQASILLKNADAALYAAKSAGRGRALAFTPDMRDAIERRVTVLRCARDAIGRDAILPFYQPKVSMETGQVVGFEALLRWTDASGVRSPGEIQEALDHHDLSIKLGARVMACAVVDMEAWTKADVPFGHVAVNVAAAQMHQGGFSEQVLGALAMAGLRADQLEVEVTERVLLDDGTGAIASALRGLHDAGVAIALDDFGTGYASLTHLTKFPVSWVKVDRSFIANMGHDGSAAAIVRAVVNLSHSIGVKVVAEGIETPEQLDVLSALGCDLGQGYLVAKPMSGSRVPFFLKTWKGWASSSHPSRRIAG